MIEYVRVGELVRRVKRATCVACGRWFEQRHGNMRRCPDCRREANRAYQHDKYLARKAKTQTYVQRFYVVGPMPCINCGTLVYFGEDTEDARREIRDVSDGWPHRCAA